MSDINHTIAVAIVETKLLLRTKVIKFYWAFLFLITVLNVLEHVIDGKQLSTIPGEYAAKFFFWSSIFKIVLSPFFVPVFIHDDRHVDTFASLYPRPFSNVSYLFGKLTGVCIVMLGIDYSFMAVQAVFDTLVNHHTFSVWPYLLYPLIVTLPLSIFICGLHTLLGYIRYPLVFVGTFFMMMVLIPLDDTESVSFLDLGGITLPLAYSAFTGFTQLGTILLQRMIFVLGGLGLLLCATVVSEFSRRSNQGRQVIAFGLLGMLLFSAGGGIAWFDQLELQSAREYREALRAHHDLLSQAPAIRVMTCDLDVTHNRREIAVNAHVSVINPNTVPVDSVLFRLNPGFTLGSVTSSSQPLSFSFEKGVLVVHPDSPLQEGTSIELDITYSGTVDGDATYLHVPEDFRGRTRREGLMVLGKEVAYITGKYVLLPPEANWYPEAVPSYPVTEPGYLQRDLTSYTLTVRSGSEMVALSQGEKTGQPGDVQIFEPEKPLTQLSLVIAPFKKTAMVVDGIEYAYYWIYRDFIGEAAFTTRDLETAIREFKEDIETKTAVTYPFKRYCLVQSPVHYFGYNSPWDMNSAWEQPETRFISEAPLYYSQLAPEDFGSVNRRNQVERLQKRVFRRLAGTSPMSTEISRKIHRKSVFLSYKGLDEFVANPFSDHSGLYSQYAVFARGQLTHNDLFNIIAVHQLKNATPYTSWIDDIAYTPFSPYYHSLDRAKYHFLNTMSLDEILHESRFHTEALDIVPTSAVSFFRLYAGITESDPLHIEHLLYDGLSTPEVDVPALFEEQCGEDILAVFEDFATRKTKARYEFSDVRLTTQTVDGQQLYNARCVVHNTTPCDGIVTIHLSLENEPYSNTIDVYFKPFEKKEVGITTQKHVSRFVLNWLPYRWLPNTTLTRNGPSSDRSYRMLREIPAPDGEQPLDGSRDMGTEKVIEIIMDNIDENCRVISDSDTKFLARLFGKRQKRENDLRLNEFDGSVNPTTWRLAYPNSAGDMPFYGPVSAVYYKQGGVGEHAVEYEVTIPEPGRYTLSLSAPKRTEIMFAAAQGLMDNGNLGETTVRVYADDGMHEDTTDISVASSAQNDWAYVGTYSFSDSTAIIRITDKTSVDLVIADAIRLVKVE